MKLPKLNQAFKSITIGLLIAISTDVWAHQPDVSSTLLAENENGEWILKVTCSASALEYEIKKTFGADSYKSKEEFDKLVLKHFRNNLDLVANTKDKLTLNSDRVKIGHESQVLFKISGMPKDLQSITIKNSSFKDIYHHQSALMVFKNGFEKKQFLLNNENNNTLKLKADSNNWVLASNMDFKLPNSLKIIGLAGILLVLGFLFYSVYKSRNYILSTRKTI